MNDNRSATFEEALQQFVEGYLQGRQPDVEEFIKQYPQHETQLRERVQDLREIETLFDSIFRAEGSEFEDDMAARDLVGRKLGSFEIVKIIGRGGMGVVYLAHDTKLKRSVAIKSMPPKGRSAGDSDSLIRFRREAELLASLNHPNIAVIHDIIEQDAAYLILEYVPGETLAERIARQPLTLKEALAIGRQVAEAVSAAHEKGIVHRDLKPGNIKITPDGRVKVLDFGLAKPPASEHKKSEITENQSGRVIGTPAYMSPEQARGGDTDCRTDIWSFGCILYQMLTAHLPFEGKTATDTLARIIEREPDWGLLPQGIPTNMRALLRRCLEKEPDRRLGDISEAAVEINETLRRPVTAPLTMAARLQKAVIIVGAAMIIVALVIAIRFLPEKQARPLSNEIWLVVLPFENLGPTEEEYFADSITDEITSRLAAIHRLRVISRQSAMQYKKSVKNTQLIAEELGVDYIVEGTVQRERPSDPNGRVKIRPRLIRTADDAHVWADIYEDDMSKVFHLQAKVAEHVAQALDITLVQPERQALAYMPTESIEAYNYYVRGNEYSLRPYQDKGNLVIAIQMYEKAVELDPLFALAHAKLSQAYSGMYHFNHDRSETRRDMAREEAKRALELNPGLPEAHWALGVYHYWCRSEYVQALEELEIARKSQPKNSRLLSTIGYVQRRQGQFEPALTNLKKALEIDPASFRLTCELGNTYRKMGEYPEAASCYEKAIQLAPDEYLPYVLQANLYLAWKESTAAARDVLEKASQYINLEAEDSIVYLLFRLDLLEGNYQQALARLPLESPTMDALSFPDALRYAEIYGYRNDKELAEEYYEKAMRTVKSKLHEDPNNAWFHSALGVAYAGLGRRDDAVREGRLAVQLQFDSEDVGERLLFRQKDLAYVYTMVGEYDEAVETLELLPSIPGTLPISWLHLKLDPAWIPLRGDARFKRLLDSDK